MAELTRPLDFSSNILWLRCRIRAQARVPVLPSAKKLWAITLVWMMARNSLLVWLGRHHPDARSRITGLIRTTT